MNFSLKKSFQSLKNIGFGVAALAASQSAFCDWTVQGNQILDPNGAPFIYRGINLGVLPSEYLLPDVMRDIAATGANAIRIPVRTFGSKEVLKKYIALCKENKLLCVLTDTSTYGYGENMGQLSYSDPWFSWMDYADVLSGTEDYVVIDITSAPTGNSLTSQYKGFTETGIFLLRFGGIKNQLIVSGANWGQDWENAMRDNAEYFQAKDPLKNIVFAVHMYEAYNDPVVIRNYLKSYLDRQLPIIISEFGPVRRYRPNEIFSPYTNKEADEDAIMQISQELGVGYLGWNWSSNAANYSELNMVYDFNAGNLTEWGHKFIYSENGVNVTAEPATHYANSSSSSAMSSHISSSIGSSIGSSVGSSISSSISSSVPRSSTPSSIASSSIRPSSASSSSRSSVSSSSAITLGSCSYVINSQWHNGFTAVIRIKNTSAQPINGWSVHWQYSDGSKITNLWNAALSGSNPYNAKNLSWNSTIQPGQTVEFGFQGTKAAGNAAIPVVKGSICP